jgi:uroporphyrin-III C-methyltransferase / precorrin-2 dehydrogenase / sirohydrochlorin ferrochelatase
MHLWRGCLRRVAHLLQARAQRGELTGVLALKPARPAEGGRVALIGCGPGDPDLLTIQALERIRAADVLIVDRLVNPQILAFARRDAECIHVGKIPRGPATAQGAINALLLRHACAGKRVARLKGGDPLIFARASEEMAALQAAGIAVEVIPGVTAAHACAARIGLPLTVRNKVRHFLVATGATSEPEPELFWQMLGREDCACAIYMGVAGAALLRSRLKAAGCRPDTPLIIVENGTMPNERAIATTLEDLEMCLRDMRILGPAVIFLGLAWKDAGVARPDSVSLYHRQRTRAATNVLEVSP